EIRAFAERSATLATGSWLSVCRGRRPSSVEVTRSTRNLRRARANSVRARARTNSRQRDSDVRERTSGRAASQALIVMILTVRNPPGLGLECSLTIRLSVLTNRGRRPVPSSRLAPAWGGGLSACGGIARGAQRERRLPRSSQNPGYVLATQPGSRTVTPSAR